MKRRIFMIVTWSLCLMLFAVMATGCSISSSTATNPNSTVNDVNGSPSTTVTYYPNGADSTPITVRVMDGKIILPTIPARAGYTFEGLYDAEEGGTLYVDKNGNCLVMIDHTMTLYGHWTGTLQTIKFDDEDGALELSTTTLSVDYDGTVLTFPVVEKEGYTFLGWASESGTMYSEGANVLRSKQTFNNTNYPIYNHTVTLYPVFEVNKLTVTFDPNHSAYQNQEFVLEYGETIPTSVFPKLTAENQELVGWSTTISGTESFSGPVTENITLYAIWKEYKTVQLHDGNKQTTIRVYRNEPFNLTTFDGFENPGYRVTGWYTTSHYAGNPVTEITYGAAAEHYYAKWGLATYTLKFDIKTAGSYIAPLTYIWGDAITLPTASKYGFTFNGWCKESDLSDTPMTSIPATMYGDYTLYAHYTPTSYIITLRSNGGSLSETERFVDYMSPYQLPVPTRTGYTFLGWGDAPNATTLYTDANGISLAAYKFDEDIELYACWKTLTYTVTFDSNGGTDVSSKTYEHNAKLTFPKEPTKNGMIFEGWFNQSLTQRYNESYRVTSNITLYAKWTESTAISTATALRAIANNPSGNYHLTTDINLNGYEWTMIPEFSGILNGKGHKIYNFTITGTEEKVGFIGTNNGTIQDLTFEDFSFSHSIADDSFSNGFGAPIAAYNDGSILDCHVKDGTMSFNSKITVYNGNYQFYYGGIVGYNNGEIDHCTASVQMNGTISIGTTYQASSYLYAGGIAGANDVSATISDCSANVTSSHSVLADRDSFSDTAYAYLYAAGLVGSNDGKLLNSESMCTINVSTDSNIEAGAIRQVHCGGAVGLNQSGALVDGCAAEGTIRAQYPITTVKLGGFVGTNEGTISNSYTSASVEGSAYEASDSKLAGFAARNSSVIQSCYAGGSVTTTTEDMTVGGFVGTNTSTIRKCFSTGNLTTFTDDNVGYFMGQNSGGSIDKCFYNRDMTVTVNGAESTPTVLNGTAEDLSNLYLDSMIFATLGWDSASWVTRQDQFPILLWQVQ